jgi:Poxvirus A32 protein
MDIADFRNIFDITECQYKNKNPFAPKWPFRLLILGPSGCGKTNLLFNLLVRYLLFDKLMIYSRHVEQPLYQCFIEELGLDSPPDDCHIKINSEIDEIIDPDELDNREQNLYVFDDFVTTKDQQKITDTFIRGRHANSSCIYLSQSYFSVPKDIRLNCNYIAIFNLHNKREILELQKEHATSVDKETFLKLYRDAISEPYSFFVIDKCTDIMSMTYRKRFDGLNLISFL